MTRSRPWWSSWLGALCLGVLAATMVSVPSVMWILYGLASADSYSGLEVQVQPGPGTLARIGYVAGGLALWALPASTVVFARRAWLGYLLLTLALAALAALVGLGLLGIL